MIARRAGLGPDRLVQGAEFVIIEIIGLLEAAAHLRLDAEQAPEARLRNIPVMRHGTECEKTGKAAILIIVVVIGRNLPGARAGDGRDAALVLDRKSTRLHSSH